jgi:hypothetical protein
MAKNWQIWQKKLKNWQKIGKNWQKLAKNWQESPKILINNIDRRLFYFEKRIRAKAKLDFNRQGDQMNL